MARVSQHTKKYARVIDIICKDLGIRPPRITWHTFSRFGGDANFNERLVRLDKNSTIEYTIKMLMHEFRHIWQYEKGYFKSLGYQDYINKNGRVERREMIKWKGEVYPFYTLRIKAEKADYYECPWEKDAYDYMNKDIERLFPGDKKKYLSKNGAKKSVADKPDNQDSLVVLFETSRKVNYTKTVLRCRDTNVNPYSLKGLDHNKIQTAINNLKSKGQW